MTQNVKHLKHPRPADSFRAKAIREHGERPKAPRPGPAWKDRVPFSGTRKDGHPVGEPVQDALRFRRRRALREMVRITEEAGLYDQPEVAA